MNSPKEILENHDLLLHDDRIEKILPHKSSEGLQADYDLSCTGKIIIPGLISAHSHLTGIFQRGLWDETSFAGWQTKSNATEDLVDLSADEIYFLHSASCIEFAVQRSYHRVEHVYGAASVERGEIDRSLPRVSRYRNERDRSGDGEGPVSRR